MKPDTLLTTHDAAKLLGVVPSSVVKWINDGLLHSYRTPGGHRRIRAADLVAFITDNGMFMPEALAELAAKPKRKGRDK